MSNGAHPILKLIEGERKKGYHCETCSRHMKIKNRCEVHISDREPCYFCHLILHHFPSENKSKDKKNSPKHSLTQRA